MKTHIHFKDSRPHGYREPKPDIPTGNTGALKERMDAIEAVANTLMTVWQATGIKIVEPEFKEGDVVYNIESVLAYEIKAIFNGRFISIDITDKGKYPYKYSFMKSEISHYYSGQQIEESELMFES